MGWPRAGEGPLEGYTWVAGQDGIPHLRSLDGGPRLRYDPENGIYRPETRTRTTGAQQQQEFSWIPTGDPTRNAAFQQIETFRTQMADAGTPITDANGGYGTVSAIAGPDGQVLGVNSTNFTQADLEMARAWRDRLDIPSTSGRAQFLFHAEAHSLMQLHQRRGGDMPAEVTLYVDRPTCPFCQSGLPSMMDEMGIQRMVLEFSNGTRAEIVDGVFRELN